MEIIAHRANLDGKESNRENTLEQVRRALELGFGLETDIRWAPAHGFSISHDSATFCAVNDAARHVAVWREWPHRTIALNIKELGCEQRPVEFLGQVGVAGQVFLFDMELLESVPGETARKYSRLGPRLRIAARASDRNESVAQALAIREASVVWLDEFDGFWATAAAVEQLYEAGKTVYAVSPELHGFSIRQARTRWDAFAHWGVDGICTDYANALRRQLGLSRSEVRKEKKA
jgi:hypothetical protein